MAPTDTANSPTATFGDRISAARDALGMDDAELARAMAVKVKTIEAWEADRSIPRANKLQMLSGVLNVSVGWLLTGDGDGIEDTGPAGSRDALAEELTKLKAQADALTRNISRLEKAVRKTL